MLLNRLASKRALAHLGGNKAWAKWCKRKGIPHAAVVHSCMELTKALTSKEDLQSKRASIMKRPAASPRGKGLCGTQAIDMTWTALKKYIPWTLAATSRDENGNREVN